MTIHLAILENILQTSLSLKICWFHFHAFQKYLLPFILEFYEQYLCYESQKFECKLFWVKQKLLKHGSKNFFEIWEQRSHLKEWKTIPIVSFVKYLNTIYTPPLYIFLDRIQYVVHFNSVLLSFYDSLYLKTIKTDKYGLLS